MDLSSAQNVHDLVPDLLHPQRVPHKIRLVLRQLQRILIPQEIRGMEHVHMQDMALDPFAAIEQPAQFTQLSVHRHAERILHRMHRSSSGRRRDRCRRCAR